MAAQPIIPHGRYEEVIQEGRRSSMSAGSFIVALCQAYIYCHPFILQQHLADDEECGSLGMHYTSVPNILKVLNPLFLDDLREQLESARDSPQKLLNLRKRMARIRVFDPACGSGNSLSSPIKKCGRLNINQQTP